jgi:hypothetical protein
MKNLFTFLFLGLFVLNTIAQNYKYGKVSFEELNEKFYPGDSTISAAILYTQRTSRYTIYEGKFYIEDEYFLRLKIYNSEGFKYATKTISYYPSNEDINGLKAATYNYENGKIVKTDLEKDGIFYEKTNKYLSKKRFTLPNLQVGSVVEWSYKIVSPNVQRLDEVLLQFTIPIKKNIASINIPEYLVYNTITKGYLTIPLKVGSTHSSAYKYKEITYNVEMNDVPALREEDFCGNINNYLSGIVFEITLTKFPGSMIKNYANGWDTVIKEIFESDSFGKELKEKNFFEEDLSIVLAGTTTEIEKVNAIFKHIKSKITYNESSSYLTDVGVKKAYKEGLGNVADINLNLVVLLRAAGINANPVLISTVDQGIPLFASYNAFDYVIAVANVGEEKLLLDATNKYNAVNVLPDQLLNFFGKEIYPNGSYKDAVIYPQKHSIDKTVINVKFSESGFEGNSRRVYNNNYALKYREKMIDQTKEVQTDLINSFNENIDILDFRISNLENLDREVIESIKFETESFYEEISGKMYISPLLYRSETSNPFKSEKREYPIFFYFPWIDNTIVTLTIPDNFKVETLPESYEQTLPNNVGGIVYKITQEGSVIQIESTVFINEPVILASDYQIIKDLYKHIIAKHAENIVLVKK